MSRTSTRKPTGATILFQSCQQLKKHDLPPREAAYGLSFRGFAADEVLSASALRFVL
jgi:hypothetical protein